MNSEETSNEPVSNLATDMIKISARDYANYGHSVFQEFTGQDYAICRYPVTQKLWKSVMGVNPSSHEGDDLPVENVSWNDCQEFLDKLNALPEVQATGVTYRLPTEDEWEFACHGGVPGDYCQLDDGTKITGETLGKVAWYDKNSECETHPVGQKSPNMYGLYDMLGNVWEWTSSETSGDRMKICGGSSLDDVDTCTGWVQGKLIPDGRDETLGLRLACDVARPNVLSVVTKGCGIAWQRARSSGISSGVIIVSGIVISGLAIWGLWWLVSRFWLPILIIGAIILFIVKRKS
jgi:hypothetical protein